MFHSAGSVVVNCLMDTLTATTKDTTSAVSEAISANNGVFAGYKVNISTVDASGTATCLCDCYIKICKSK